MIHLLIKTWDGSESRRGFIRRSLKSLLESEIPDAVRITVYDDASPSRELLSELTALKRTGAINLIAGEHNLGPNKAQEVLGSIMHDSLIREDFFITADDDVLYHPAWFQELLGLYRDLRDRRDVGVFSAINMPFRRSLQVLNRSKGSAILKHRQPAVNWLIPREVYLEAGPFEDEGVAWDTSYCHRLRLMGKAIACLSPSHLQNIGTTGAYATDDTMISLDYIGQPRLRRIQLGLRWHATRLNGRLRMLVSRDAEILAPVRWGSEFVYEGRDSGGACLLVDDPSQHELSGHDRAKTVERTRKVSAALEREGLRGPIARFSRLGELVRIEHPWRYLPNARELHRHRRIDASIARRILIGTLEALLPLHRQGVIHNKVRPENVFVDIDDTVSLAWAGTEPRVGQNCTTWDSDTSCRHFARAVSRWTDASVQRRHAENYMTSLAPEVAAGSEPTVVSDLFSAAAVVCQLHPSADQDPNGTYSSAAKRRSVGSLAWVGPDPRLYQTLQRLLAENPSDRPASASEALSALTR